MLLVIRYHVCTFNHTLHYTRSIVVQTHTQARVRNTQAFSVRAPAFMRRFKGVLEHLELSLYETRSLVGLFRVYFSLVGARAGIMRSKAALADAYSCLTQAGCMTFW